MTTERDPAARIVLSWLREDAHENAEGVLLRALDAADTTPQRRSWWPARRFLMPTYAKLVAAVAALVVVAVVGYNLLPGSSIGGRSTPAPTPSPTLTAEPLPSDDTIGLAAGDYVTGSPFPVRVTATVPTGWHGHVPGPYYADLWKDGLPGGIYFLIPSDLAADPCDAAKGWVGIPGTSVDAFTAALHDVPGITISNVASVTISGYKGTSLVLTAAPVITGCKLSQDGYVIWKNPLNGAAPALSGGEPLRVWVLDIAGQRLVITVQDAQYGRADLAEAQAVFDSIRLAPAG
jgi:hypothetical protein